MRLFKNNLLFIFLLTLLLGNFYLFYFRMDAVNAAAPVTMYHNIKTWAVSGVEREIGIKLALDKQLSSHLEIVDPPAKGEASAKGLRLFYQSFEGERGTDRFSFCIVGADGERSATFQCKIKLRKDNIELDFSSLTPELEAAVKNLISAKILSEQTVAELLMSSMDATVSGPEFLVAMLGAHGMFPKEIVTTGLPNDGEIPAFAKGAFALLMKRGIISAEEAISLTGEIDNITALRLVVRMKNLSIYRATTPLSQVKLPEDHPDYGETTSAVVYGLLHQTVGKEWCDRPLSWETAILMLYHMNSLLNA